MAPRLEGPARPGNALEVQPPVAALERGAVGVRVVVGVGIRPGAREFVAGDLDVRIGEHGARQDLKARGRVREEG